MWEFMPSCGQRVCHTFLCVHCVSNGEDARVFSEGRGGRESDLFAKGSRGGGISWWSAAVKIRNCWLVVLVCLGIMFGPLV